MKQNNYNKTNTAAQDYDRPLQQVCYRNSYTITGDNETGGNEAGNSRYMSDRTFNSLLDLTGLTRMQLESILEIKYGSHIIDSRLKHICIILRPCAEVNPDTLPVIAEKTACMYAGPRILTYEFFLEKTETEDIYILHIWVCIEKDYPDYDIDGIRITDMPHRNFIEHL